jgi:DNA-binding HxlR family transcriptional regulator
MKAVRSGCPIAATLDVVGDRWSLVVLRDILFLGKRRYREFASSPEAIATNVLADRLARLEECGIISKAPDPDDRRQFLYTPTERGLDLIPVLFGMIRWGLKHVDGTKARTSRKTLSGGEEAFEQAVRARFKRQLSSSMASTRSG